MRFSLQPPGPFICGRDAQMVVALSDPMASRHHCRIEEQNGAYQLVDLDSANGTYLNGDRVERHPLASGDRLQLGETTLTFLVDEKDPLIGKTISGFQVLERIGQGGMGTVYKARQISLDRFVALKVLSKELVANRTFTELFHREARAAGQINHPSIVQVYDVDTVQVEGQTVTFFAMEYMPHGSVEDLLNKEKQLSLERALEIALDTARGIQFAERQGMVHRDIKPGNLMIGDGGMVKIGDLGIARRASEGNKVSQRDGISGSPHYISPEQAMGRDLDSGADMYSLGITLYQLLAGRPPFLGSNPKEIVLKHVREELPDIGKFRPELPPAVAALIKKMTEKDRAQRYPSAEALVADLERILDESRAAATAAASAVAGWGGLWKYAARSLTIAAALLLLGLIGIISLQQISEQRHRHQEEIGQVRRTFQEAFDRIQKLLDENAPEKARVEYEQLMKLAKADPRLEKHVADLPRQLSHLLGEIEAAEEALRTEALNAAADGKLAEISAACPADLQTEAEEERLEKCIAALEELAQNYSSAPAAQRARQQAGQIRERIKAFQNKRRRAEDEWLRIESQLRAFLGASPPRYKLALDALRSFPAEFAGTPASAKGQEKMLEVEKNMEAAALAWIEEARRGAAEGKAQQAIRRLELLRLELEGKALQEIEATIAELKN